MAVSAAALAAAVRGVVVGDPDAVATSFAIDSRELAPGACFVALQGERDGHDFVSDAFARGARVALVSRPVAHPRGTALVVVDDPLAALARAAADERARWQDVAVVGITGSAGKTSTKDLTAAALGRSHRVHASPGSFNNEAGLPLTVLGAPTGTDVVIAEMGARFAGDIADLCAIAAPTVGVVTHIGLAHAEHLGGRAGIVAAKGELVEALAPSGLAVLNADDDATPLLAARTAGRVVTVGTGSGDVVVRDLRLDRELRPTFVLDSPWGAVDVALAVRGAHQALNAAMGATVALALGAPPAAVAEGLAAATTAAWRMELTTSPDGVVVLNDAYNASPTSVRAALHSLATLPTAGRRIAVLGDMLELGPHTEEEHAALGSAVAQAGVDLLVAVGPASAATAASAARHGVTARTATDRDDATALVVEQVQPGDVVLVKASRAVGLELVAEALARGVHAR